MLLSGIVVLIALTALTGPGLTPTAWAQKKEGKKSDTKQPAVALTVEVYKDAGGDFRFRIKDGETLLASSGKGYDKKDEVIAVVDKLKSNMACATPLKHGATRTSRMPDAFALGRARDVRAIACASDANTNAPSSSRAKKKGFTPSWSRAPKPRARAASQTKNANIPDSLAAHAAPHRA